MNRTMTFTLDELDYDAVQRAIAKRQLFGRGLEGVTQTLLPEGVESDLTGAVIAEICRGWLEFLDLTPPRRAE